MSVLKDYYRTVRSHMKESAPHLKFVFYAAGEFSGANWNDLFPDDDMENVILDKHNYNAWWSTESNISGYCTKPHDGWNDQMAIAQEIKYPVWIGEWSLATDVCAMWLGGFNDNSFHYVE